MSATLEAPALDTAVVVGFDGSGTDLKFGALNAAGKVLLEGKIPSYAKRKVDPSGRGEVGPSATVAQIKAAYLRMQTEALEKHIAFEVEVAGLDTPGPATGEGVIKESPNLPETWIDFDIRTAVSEALGLQTAYLNDGLAGLRGELALGGYPAGISATMIMPGTGVGGGISHQGQLITSADGCACHLGHIMIDPRLADERAKTRICGCHAVNCVEAHASLTAFAAMIEEDLAAGAVTSLRDELPEKRSGAARDHALAGDRYCLKLFDYAYRCIGLALSSAVKFNSPDVIIIGGGMAETAYKPLHAPLLESVRQTYSRHCLGPQRDKPIVFAKAGDCAYIGAALYAYGLRLSGKL